MNKLMKRRRALMISACSNVDISSLVFSYTGTWTDSVMEIDGSQYRVLQLKSDGTLTLDPRMVNRIPFDVWCVRQGDTGKTGSSNATYYGSGSDHGIAGSCPKGGGPGTSKFYSAPNGADGAAGGWAMAYGVKATSDSYTASVSSPANLNGIISVSNTTRTGTAWFSLPSTNNGAGGAGGSGAAYGECSACGETWGSHYGRTGSVGTHGIVVIRIPIN